MHKCVFRNRQWDDLVLSELIMWIGHRKEIGKPTFWVLALRRSESCRARGYQIVEHSSDNEQCSAAVGSWKEPPNIWLTVAKNAFLVAVRMLLKGTVIICAVSPNSFVRAYFVCFLCSFVCFSFVFSLVRCSFVFSFVGSLVRSVGRSVGRSVIRLFVQSLVCSFVHTFVCSFERFVEGNINWLCSELLLFRYN